MDALSRLKIRLDVKDDAQDELLELLLLEAAEHILGYTRRDDMKWLPAFNNIQVQIAAVNYGRLGMEGMLSRTEGAVTTGYLGAADYPDSIIKPLDRFRLIKGL